MSKTFLALFAGVLFGLIIHLSIILLLPLFPPTNAWKIFAKIAPIGEVIILERPLPGKANILRLDPELAYAVCRYDLSNGPGLLSGELTSDFWSVGVVDKNGVTIFSTRGSSSINNYLELGIFNPAQTRLLAEQQLGMQEGLIIVEAPRNQVFVVVRYAPPYPQMWDRYSKVLSKLNCSYLSDSLETIEISE